MSVISIRVFWQMFVKFLYGLFYFSSTERARILVYLQPLPEKPIEQSIMSVMFKQNIRAVWQILVKFRDRPRYYIFHRHNVPESRYTSLCPNNQ